MADLSSPLPLMPESNELTAQPSGSIRQLLGFFIPPAPPDRPALFPHRGEFGFEAGNVFRCCFHGLELGDGLGQAAGEGGDKGFTGKFGWQTVFATEALAMDGLQGGGAGFTQVHGFHHRRGIRLLAAEAGKDLLAEQQQGARRLESGEAGGFIPGAQEAPFLGSERIGERGATRAGWSRLPTLRA